MIRYRERWPYWRVVEGLDYSSRAAFDQRSRRNGPRINQVRMSDRFCHVPAQTDSRWAIEDLLYADKDSDFEKKAPKYAVQGRGVFATGMHRSQIELGHMQGEEGWAWWSNMRYYHYHNILSALKERNCYQYVNYTTAPIFQFQDQTLQLDTSMVYMATLAKEFHTVQIGQQ
ncbi:hypothetical protein GOP47_0011170 [Adiantum capillus-veneris]|uniref:Uncharacterized protein n=1 Tax=Adiantum capillus-veneris TaxID=13818 RepID=A0A9D4USR2_ADICA|nr:hypothetical protein GOP47_0011170 [Adiantum capillus-veneris]